MKKAELQKLLDKRRYIKSEKAKKDLSGFMEYCDYCVMRKTEFQVTEKDGKAFFEIVPNGCRKPQKIREKYSLCGKAYIKRDHERRRVK